MSFPCVFLSVGIVVMICNFPLISVCLIVKLDLQGRVDLCWLVDIHMAAKINKQIYSWRLLGLLRLLGLPTFYVVFTRW